MTPVTHEIVVPNLTLKRRIWLVSGLDENGLVVHQCRRCSFLPEEAVQDVACTAQAIGLPAEEWTWKVEELR